MRERDVEKYLVMRVKAAGGEVRKLKWIGRHGAPDRLVFLPKGRLIFVEVKAPGKKPEEHQHREILKLMQRGQSVRVVDSFEAVEVLIDPRWRPL